MSRIEIWYVEQKNREIRVFLDKMRVQAKENYVKEEI